MLFLPVALVCDDSSTILPLQCQIHDCGREIIAEVNWPDLSAVFEYTAQSNANDCGMAAHIAMPALACMAVGGEAEQAIPLAASWELYYWAAAVLDDVIDRDHPTRLWHSWEYGRALNVGVGLLMAAQVCLSRLNACSSAITDIHAFISQMLLQMTKGQAHPPAQPTLEAYFEYIIQKTAIFFAAFARAGARLHSNDAQATQTLFDYGLALGIAAQLRNDRERASLIADAQTGVLTLPILYGLTNSKHPLHARLTELWNSHDAACWPELRDILIEMETPRYCAQVEQMYAKRACRTLNDFPTARVKYLLALAGDTSGFSFDHE